MANDYFRIKLNKDEILSRLKDSHVDIQKVAQLAARQLSIGARDHIIQKAQTELEGFKRDFFLGQENDRNVKWEQISENLYVVYLDPKVKWIEEGREPTSMATEGWLLKNPKISKKGKKYKVIPFTHAAKGSRGQKSPNTALTGIVHAALAKEGINLKEIETDKHGKPKLGVLHKIKLHEPSRVGKWANLFSMPRTAEMSARIGLPAHEGIFYGKGLVITQRKDPQTGKIKREAVTFRVVHEDHVSEGRWLYPRVEPFNSIEDAYKWAQTEWDRILDNIEKEFKT